MKCPVDSATLLITERKGVEIDYCPECRGVWLDRGELDKLITLNDQSQSAAYQEVRLEDRQRESNDRYTGEYAKPKRKKESFLADIFDFGD